MPPLPLATAPLVNASWLLENIAKVRIVDTRFALGKPNAGREEFSEAHIPTAVFADLERDLSAPPQADRRGGRHPLPAIERLEATLSALGISNTDQVIVYDDPCAGSGYHAAHFWWILRYLGHDAVSVLDGGFAAWQAAGGATESGPPLPNPGSFQAKPRPEMLVDAAYVQNRGTATVLVDSRAPERFRGEFEPLDWKAGHIPGAVNMDWSQGLSEGHFLTPEAQQERFKGIQNAAELIVYCGSGVSAGANMLALELAGISGAKLYAGSWSDWISDECRPFLTGG